jgi:hypothetical protein
MSVKNEPTSTIVVEPCSHLHPWAMCSTSIFSLSEDVVDSLSEPCGTKLRVHDLPNISYYILREKNIFTGHNNLLTGVVTRFTRCRQIEPVELC